MTDHEQALLVEVSTDVKWIKRALTHLPCAREGERLAAAETDIAVLKNQANRRNGIAAGLGAFAAALTMLGKYLLGKV